MPGLYIYRGNDVVAEIAAEILLWSFRARCPVPHSNKCVKSQCCIHD